VAGLSIDHSKKIFFGQLILDLVRFWLFLFQFVGVGEFSMWWIGYGLLVLAVVFLVVSKEGLG